MKQPSIKTLRNKADRLWSQLIRTRDGGCRRCFRQQPEVVLQAAHVISRRYKAIRWDERNGVSLCVGCHHFAHKQPIEADWFFQELIGQDVYQALRKEALEYVGEIKRVDLNETIQRLETSLRELEAA